MTTLRKISYRKGKLKAVAQGKVKGYLNDTFSLDEYKGNLRLFTTNDDENLVTILDKKLDKISSIENLAKGESIYSARFMKEAGYFVTYEQVIRGVGRCKNHHVRYYRQNGCKRRINPCIG